MGSRFYKKKNEWYWQREVQLMVKLKDLLNEKQLNEKAYVDMNATFELKGYGTNIFIKGKTTEIQLSFKGDDLQKALEKGKGKGRVVMAGVKTND